MTAGEEVCNEQIFKDRDIRLRCGKYNLCFYLNEAMLQPSKPLFILHISF